MFKNIPLRTQIILASTLVGLFVLYSLGTMVLRGGETKVVITVIPGDATVFIDGKQSKDGTHYMKPGEYTFSAKKDGFKEDTLKVNVEDQEVEVGLIPSADSEEAEALFSQNEDLQAQREAIGAKRASKSGLSREDVTPLIALLPVTEINGPFTLDYGPSETRDNGVFIEVSDSSPGGRKNAQKWMKERGMDPTDLEIRYTDFVNPLAGGTN